MSESDTATRSADPLNEVRTLLAAAHITAPDGDLASLARILPSTRRRVDRMYAVDTGDEVTAAVFRADPSDVR
jgi:hypothetical protein